MLRMLRGFPRAAILVVFCLSFAGALTAGLSFSPQRHGRSSGGGTLKGASRTRDRAGMGNAAPSLLGGGGGRHRRSIHHPQHQLSMATRGGGEEQWLDDVDEEPQQDRLRGRLTLLLVAFLYGTLNVVLRQLYATHGPPSASALSATRGWLAAACFLPAIPQIRSEIMQTSADGSVSDSEGEEKRAPLLMVAVELAFWNFLTQGLVNVGLLFTEAARASFFTQTSVVITPLISMMQGNRVGRNVWIGCASALAGLALLSTEGGGDAVSSTADGVTAGFMGLAFSGGDLLVLSGAVCWSIYIVRTSTIGDRYPEVSLQAVKTVALAIFYTTWLSFSIWRCFNAGVPLAGLWSGWQNPAAWALLAYSAIGPGALADVLQQNGQKEVSASEANVILCSEPIFTAFLAFVIAGETTTVTENAGGALVVLAAILASSGSSDEA